MAFVVGRFAEVDGRLNADGGRLEEDPVLSASCRSGLDEDRFQSAGVLVVSASGRGEEEEVLFVTVEGPDGLEAAGGGVEKAVGRLSKNRVRFGDYLFLSAELLGRFASFIGRLDQVLGQWARDPVSSAAVAGLSPKALILSAKAAFKSANGLLPLASRGASGPPAPSCPFNCAARDLP